MIARCNIGLQHPASLEGHAWGHAKNRRQVLLTATTGNSCCAIPPSGISTSSTVSPEIIVRSTRTVSQTRALTRHFYRLRNLCSWKVAQHKRVLGCLKISMMRYLSLTSNPGDLSWTGCLQLLGNITIIIHNTWRLDFLRLSSPTSVVLVTLLTSPGPEHMVPP